ncbi:uncharacterized protein UTRI_03122 [Ustilago trichophora]|uniref:Uncharacterized protein n=1 Tax=Ustilago trichophora TaxID=86804 RepID=A0A5C3E815_9BASI|nr:uncharacterized protein UTRI_03122 [Ustilago trichophora]
MTSNIASTSSSAAPTSAQAERQAKMRTALEHKSRGNASFTQGDIKSALASYHHAVLYLSGLEQRSILGLVGENSGKDGRPEDLSSDDESESEATEGESEKQLSVVYSNISACYLKQNNYPRAIETAEKSLKCDSRNVKAKFRKVQALRLSGDVYKAKAVLEDTIEGLKGRKGKKEKEAVEDFERELKAVQKTIEAKEAAGRNKWKGFLGKNPKVFDVGGAAAAAAVAETSTITADDGKGQEECDDVAAATK